MNAAIDLESFRGFLTTDEENQQREATGRFNTARNRFVYDALKMGESPEALKHAIRDEIEAMIAAENYRAGTYHFVRDELFSRIDREAGKSPLIRSVWRWMPTALGVLLVCAYFAVRAVSGVTVDQPETSRVGLMQRAAAFEKVARYDDWISAGSRPGSAIQTLLLWPIEPDEAEVAAANEFVGITMAGYSFVVANGEACGPSIPNDSSAILTKSHLALVQSVAEFVQRDGVKWLEPPALTLLEPIKSAYPCR